MGVCASVASALEVCFNTIALTFLLEIDNVLYTVLVPESARIRLDLVRGDAELGHIDEHASTSTRALIEEHTFTTFKLVHFTSMGLGIRCCLFVLGNGDSFQAMVFMFMVAGA